MDDVATRASVSKQTVYKQYASKEALFVEVVTTMTTDAGNRVRTGMPDVAGADELAAALHAYAQRQLMVVLTPTLMQLRRLVIAEATRFPDLGAALYAGGPGAAIASLAKEVARWTDQGLLRAEDPTVVATHFNWLVMGEATNRVMMMGNGAIPGRQTLKRYAEQAVTAFLAAYGTRKS